MSKVRYGRFPPVLADELLDALRASEWLGEDRMRMLNLYRSNRARGIAAGGLHADFNGVSDGIQVDALPYIQRLDEAFQKLHAYRAPGGARRYISDSVAVEFGRQGGRPPLHDDEAIVAAIKATLAAHKGEKKLKATNVIDAVQELFKAKKMAVPGRTKISDLIRDIRDDPC